MKLERILVAVKPWERGLPLAANHASQLLQTATGHIDLVGTAYDAAVAAGRDRGEAAARVTQDRAVEAARVELERLARAIRDYGVKITTRIVWGVPAYEGILSAAEECRADLVVVGAHEPHTSHTRLTDTDWQIMRRVSCPLLLVKSPVFNGYRTVLAGVDPLHARDEPEGPDRAVLEAGRCFARAFSVALRATDLDAMPENNAELVVVGVPRRLGVPAEDVGSNAATIATAAPCDVLIVPTEREVHAHPLSQIG